MQKGRPAKQKQLQIAELLRLYYERGMTATFTARKTGHNTKTVCRYFGLWNVEDLETQEKDFLSRQKKERERTLLTLDLHADELYSTLDDINGEILKYKKLGKGIPRYLFSLRVEIIKTISAMTERKGLFAMQPIMDEFLEGKNLEEERRDFKEHKEYLKRKEKEEERLHLPKSIGSCILCKGYTNIHCTNCDTWVCVYHLGEHGLKVHNYTTLDQKNVS